MGWTVSVAPATEPVSLTEAKAFLRVEVDAEDALIGSLIQAARQHVETICNRALITQTWVGVFDSFPSGPLWIPGDVQDVYGVTIMVDGVATVYDEYFVRTQYPAVMTPESGVWPTTDTRPDAVMIEALCGYGDAADVPAQIKTAILMLVAQWFNTREASTARPVSEVPMAVRAMLFPFRDGRFM